MQPRAAHPNATPSDAIECRIVEVIAEDEETVTLLIDCGEEGPFICHHN